MARRDAGFGWPKKKREITDKAKEALAASRAKKRQEHPSLKSADLAGILIAADWLEENAANVAHKRGVTWEAGSVSLDASIAEADPRDVIVQAAVSGPGHVGNIPPFWFPPVVAEGDLTERSWSVHYPPLIPTSHSNRPGRSMTKDEFAAWRGRQVEAAYLKYAPAGASHALRSRLHHKLAFVRVGRGDKNPGYSVNGVLCRLVVCYERAALAAMLERLVNPEDVPKYLSSPCRSWPGWDDESGRWTYRSFAAVSPMWTNDPTFPPGKYPDVERLTLCPQWKNQEGKWVVAECLKPASRV